MSRHFPAVRSGGGEGGGAVELAYLSPPTLSSPSSVLLLLLLLLLPFESSVLRRDSSRSSRAIFCRNATSQVGPPHSGPVSGPSEVDPPPFRPLTVIPPRPSSCSTRRWRGQPSVAQAGAGGRGRAL